ncbi:MAG: EI24 domain-containing protein [Burkholderiaceae bacterium]
MNKVIGAISRAFTSLFHPRMLALLALPFAVALAAWILVAWFAWTPITNWLETGIFDSNGAMSWVYEKASSIGIGWIRDLLSSLVALLLIVPLIFGTAMALIAVLATPVVTRHLGGGEYRDVDRRGSWSVAASIWNALSSLGLFLVGYLVTLPLWLIPPLAFVVPWLWWSWLTARMMRFDSLVEHASVEERRRLISSDSRAYLAVGLLTTVLNYIPPLFLVTPVLSALAFVHYSLARLREQRAGTVSRRA